MLSVKRILRLAEKYGPFVRFYPDGSEGSDEDDEAKKKAAEQQEQGNKQEFEKTRQRADQEAANARKAREELSERQSELETAHTENESLKEKLAEAETKAAQAGIKDVELEESEYQGTDLNLVRAIKSLKEEQTVKDKEIKALKDKATGYEERERKEQAKVARDSAYEELLSDLDGEYGADCRNDAVQKFDELCKKGDVPKGNPALAARKMEKCYKEVKAAKSKESKEKEKSSLSLDSGSGGGSPPSLSGATIPSGLSLDEAVDHLAAAAKK